MYRVFNSFPIVIAAAVIAAPTFAQSGSFSGNYAAKTDGSTVTLTLNQAADGTVTGTLIEDPNSPKIELKGQVTDGGKRITGKMIMNGEPAPIDFDIRREGGKLRVAMIVAGQEDVMMFSPTGKATPDPTPPTRPEEPAEPTPAATGGNSSAGFAGTFKGAEVSITLSGAGGNRFTGNILMGGKKYPVTAMRVPQGLEGTFTADGTKFDFRAKLEGNTLLLNSDGTTHMLLRQGGASPTKAANPLAAKNKPAPANPLAKKNSGGKPSGESPAPAAMSGNAYRHPTGLHLPLAAGWRVVSAGLLGLMPPGVTKPDNSEGYLLILTDVGADRVVQKLDEGFQQQAAAGRLHRVDSSGPGFIYEGDVNGTSVRVRCFVAEGQNGLAAVLLANGTKEKMAKREPTVQAMMKGATFGSPDMDSRLVGTWRGGLVTTDRDVRGTGGNFTVTGATDSSTSYRLDPNGVFTELTSSRSIFIGQGVSIDTGDQVDKKEGRWAASNGILCIGRNGVLLTGSYRFENGRLIATFGDKTLALRQ